jgi:hypothetical protein
MVVLFLPLHALKVANLARPFYPFLAPEFAGNAVCFRLWKSCYIRSFKGSNKGVIS